MGRRCVSFVQKGGGKWQCLSDDVFLHSFNTTFPLPQGNYWSMCQLASEISTRVISELRGKKLRPESWMRLPKNGASIGRIGNSTRVTWESARSFQKTKSHGTKKSLLSRASLAECVVDTTGASALSGFKQYQSRYAPSERRVNWCADTTQPTAHRDSTLRRWKCNSKE